MKQRMFFGAMPKIFEFAKQLRKNMTEAEKLLWFQLKQNPKGYKFRRQHPIAFYIADFYCHKAKLVIEVDGSIHQREDILINDIDRQKMLEDMGLTVIRFVNRDIFQNMDYVIGEIDAYLIIEEYQHRIYKDYYS